jgi:homeobox-leucine zipper protein
MIYYVSLSLLSWCSSFQECTHPDHEMRQELAAKVGIEAMQVKFWFQNRRTQIKVYL